jgi:hypothetical protein
MITKHLKALMVAAFCVIVADDCLAREALFYKVSRNYAADEPLGRVYRTELETRMFMHSTWHERLYCNPDEPDIDETLEVYSKPDGSRWLNYRRATPSISRIIRSRVVGGAKFDLKKKLDEVRISNYEVALPAEVANEIELLWRVMLPGSPREPKEPKETVTLHLNVTVLIAFAKEDRSVKTGGIAMLMHNTTAYREFADVVDDLIKLCEHPGGATDPIFARLPDSIRRLRTRLRKT